jgi:ribonuclease HI
MQIWTDGSNKKIGFITEDGFSEIWDEKGTNNENEYKAVKMALTYAVSEGMTRIQIFSDSQLIVQQLNHIWHIKMTN